MDEVRKTISLPVSAVVDGRRWRLFGFTFDTADGPFAGHLYALSLEHAVALLEELKASARIDGEVLGELDGIEGLD